MESKQKVIGILRENKSKWERRCALTPKEVLVLTSHEGIKVLVQPSPSRCYTDEEFEEAGAIIQEDFTSCDVIFGVKEVPIENLISNKTYFFFSHVIKAQEYNMGLLDAMIAKGLRMIDYECIREGSMKTEGEVANRLVAFGRYAGIAGAFDFFRGIGEYMLQKKLNSPFIFIGSTYMYEDYDAMKAALAGVAKSIAKSGTPKKFSPMVFAVTGTGRVAQGIMEVLEQLPHIKVEPDQLKNLAEIMGTDNKRIVISQFSGKHIVRHKEGLAYDRLHYYANPNQYVSKFAEDYLEHIHFLINGVYWEAKYPRLISINELRDAVIAGKSKLMGVCDISADYMGSIEFTTRFTSIEDPFLLYDPITEEFHEKIDKATDNTILFHSVDHLPAEMPKEASNHFGEQLISFVKAVADSDPSLPFDQQQKDLPQEIYNAVVCCHGELTPRYRYITDFRTIREKAKLHQQEYMQHVHEAERKTSSLRRGMRFATLVFTGHLFDTKFFNTAIDILEENKIDFRVIDWKVGLKVDHSSEIAMQLMAPDPESMDKAKECIEREAKKRNVVVSEGAGPAFDAKIQEEV